MLITKKIKLEVSKRDAATLEFMQAKCRGLYNWWVMKLRHGESWPLSQRQMVMKQHHEKNRQRNRAIYNDWGLYTFIMMLTYKCQLYGKELVILDERNTSKTCHCGSGPTSVRSADS